MAGYTGTDRILDTVFGEGGSGSANEAEKDAPPALEAHLRDGRGKGKERVASRVVAREPGERSRSRSRERSRSRSPRRWEPRNEDRFDRYDAYYDVDGEYDKVKHEHDTYKAYDKYGNHGKCGGDKPYEYDLDSEDENREEKRRPSSISEAVKRLERVEKENLELRKDAQEQKLSSLTDPSMKFQFQKDTNKDSNVLLQELLCPLKFVASGLRKLSKKLDEGVSLDN